MLESGAGTGESGRPRQAGWRRTLWQIIFESDTAAGRAFDAALLVVIVVSVAAVMLESVASVRSAWGGPLRVLEWLITGLFTLEYAARLAVSRQPWRYATSFFGVIDLLAVLPTWLSLLLPGTHSLAVVRGLRLLRVFRVLKLGQFLSEANLLLTAVTAARRKVLVFLSTVVILVVIMGTAMYLLESDESGFTSIPRSIYWAVVTLTTVGYGDITPKTVAGQLLAVVIMLIGYAIIAVPTGIVTAEIIEASRQAAPNRPCPTCGSHGHAFSDRFCSDCGAPLPVVSPAA